MPKAKEVSIEDLLESWVAGRNKFAQANKALQEATAARDRAQTEFNEAAGALYRLQPNVSTVYQVGEIGVLLVPGQYPTAVTLNKVS